VIVMRTLCVGVALWLNLSSALASALPVTTDPNAAPRGPDTTLMQCFARAGERYRIDPLLLYAIAEVESRLDPRATNRNRDGSIDYGLMQVNSQHLPRLESQGIDARRLLQEPCVSIHTGASILADMISRYGYTWAAVGAYNAGGSDQRVQARARYAQKVWRRYGALVSGRSDRLTPPRPDARGRKPRPAPSGFVWRADDDRLVPATSSAKKSPSPRKQR